MRGGGESGEGGTTATKKGPWTAAEDAILSEYVRKHGEGNWNAVQKNSCLLRCGKSCRLRWANHLRPDLKKGCFTHEEELVVLRLHAQMGNKWARMAALLPGRTDNDIKNYWNTRVKRRHRAGLALYPPDVVTPPPTPAAAAPLSGFSPLFPQNPFKPLFAFPLSPVSPHPPFYHHHHHESFDLSPIPVLPLPVNPELPSNQFFNRTAGSGGGDGAGGELQQQRGTLLAESAGLERDHMWGPLGVGEDSSCGWGRPALDPVSKLDGFDVCFGIKTQIGAMHQDISTLLDMIPGTSAASAIPEWYNSPSGEMSNGPSSSSIVTDHDDIGLEMQQLASSPSINAAANWELSGSWNNPSGICL